MTLASLRTDTERRLRETSTSLVPFDATAIDAALNRGYMEISDATNWHEDQLYIDLLAYRPYYDARAIVGDTFLSLGMSFNVQTNRWLTPIHVSDLDRRDLYWEIVTANSGAPWGAMLRGLWWIAYWPRSAAGTGTIKQYVVTLPEPMVRDTDEPGFPSAYQYGLVEYAVYDLWSQIGETVASMQAWGNYLKYEGDLTLWVQGRAQTPMLQGYGTRP